MVRPVMVMAGVYLGPRSMAASLNVPLSGGNPLLDGTPYKARVEVMDAPTDIQTSRSDSSFVSFTLQSSDYNAARLLINSAGLYNRTDSNGALSTDAFLSVSSPEQVSSVDLRNSAGSVIYTFQAGDRSNQDFNKTFTTPLAPGSYTIHFVANGLDHYAPVTLTTPVSYPIPSSSTMQAEDQGNDFIRFSWANVNHTGPVFYRVFIYDQVTGPETNGPVYSSGRQSATFVDVPKAALGDLASKQWRVEVVDSSHFTTQRNRMNGPLIDLNPIAYNAARPVLNSWRVRGMSSSAGVTRTQVLVNATPSEGVVLSEILVTGPNGFSRDLLTQGSFLPAYGAYVLEQEGAPAAGLYTISAKDSAGRSATRYIYQPAAHAVPPVDFKTLHTNLDPNGDLRISWAPVLSDVPIWYQVSIFNSADQNGDGLMDQVAFTPSARLDLNADGVVDQHSVYPLASVTIPAGIPLPASAMIRITALDSGQSVSFLAGTLVPTSGVVHNASQSALVKAEAVGFDYGSLSDGDGDGFASNIDPNDANAAIYPFSGGASVRTLTVQNGGSGSGTVTSSPAGISCLTGVSAGCSAGFVSGSQVTLTPTASLNSLFAGWGGACSGTGSCQVTMDAAKEVSAGFDLQPGTVRIDDSSASYHSLGAALDAVVAAGTVRARAQTFTEELILDNPATIRFRGGFTDGAFSILSPTGFTVLSGSLKIQRGTLKPERLLVR